MRFYHSAIDFCAGSGHKQARQSVHMKRGAAMNTDGFDKHAKANLAFYEGFMNFSKIVIVAIAITLAAMAYFLL